MMRNKNSGFHVVELLVVMLLVAVVGFIGFRVWQANHPPAQSTSSQSASVPVIKSATDLDSVDTFVNQLDTAADTNDLTNIEKELGSL